MKRLAIWAITLYQRAVSPMLPPACRFAPSCSEYARIAIETHGMARGGLLAILRIGRCHPFHPGGFDPVPGTTRPTPPLLDCDPATDPAADEPSPEVNEPQPPQRADVSALADIGAQRSLSR